MVKICNKCGEADRCPDGKCRPCHNRYQRETRARQRLADPDGYRAQRRLYYKEHCRGSMREHLLKRMYGLSRGDYESILFTQGGKCAICKDNTALSPRGEFFVDHDHKSGCVRGLLCSKCNTGLGNFLDSPVILTMAIDYLVEHKFRHEQNNCDKRLPLPSPKYRDPSY